MIRIDEIYNHTFWPWLERNSPGARLLFCDPPGKSDPESLCGFGNNDALENQYIFLHDQEPIHLDLHETLFKEVLARNNDLSALGHVIVSEQGEFVKQLKNTYGWTSHYYFYHGWACLDWFRGYDKTFLIPRAVDRTPTRTFMSPNRIIGGKRDHRVLFLYQVFKHGLQNNHISAPRICPAESVDISSIAQKYQNVYQDIEIVLARADLPRTFAGETTQEMSSYRLSNFVEAQDSLIYVPTETVFSGQRLHLTEKTFKAIALEMPFVLLAAVGSLEYLRSYGFQTFASIIDESYDDEQNDMRRVEKVVALLKQFDNLSQSERQQMHRHMLPTVQHNYHHFYHGGFAEILWQELNNMLNNLCKQLHD